VKALLQLKYNWKDDIRIADKFYSLRAKGKILKAFKARAKLEGKQRRIRKQLRRIVKQFRLRTILREWRRSKSMMRKEGTHGAGLVFRAVYSEHCKCRGCLSEKRLCDIHPDEVRFNRE